MDWSSRGDVDKNGRRFRANLVINPVGPLKNWLDTQKQHFNIAQEDEMKQSFNSQLKAIQALINQVQMCPDSAEAARLDYKEEPVSTGAALLTWLRGPDVTVTREEAMRAVSQIWPKLSYASDDDTQMQSVAISDDATIEQLIKAVEERVRNCQSRCARHQTLLHCICPTYQSKSCVECNESLVQVKCNRDVRVKLCRVCNTWCEAREFTSSSTRCTTCQPARRNRKRARYRRQDHKPESNDERCQHQGDIQSQKSQELDSEPSDPCAADSRRIATRCSKRKRSSVDYVKCSERAWTMQTNSRIK